MAKKKILLVLVEGPSDSEALAPVLSEIFGRDNLRIEVLHTDITTKFGASQRTIKETVWNIISKHQKTNYLKSSDYSEVIHIVDTDGAYVPNDRIVEDPALTEVVYEETYIRAKKKSAIEKRNAQKAVNLSCLCGTGCISKIPYRIFYMSSNLDHVLYNKQNSTVENKRKDSYAFAAKYRKDVQGFIDYIKHSDFSVSTEYAESWRFIRQGMHSLERHTNLGIILPDVYEGKKKTERS